MSELVEAVHIILVNPPCALPATQRPNGDKFVAEHIGLGYLAASIREKRPEIDVEIIDAYLLGLPAELIADRICTIDPLLVGFSVSYHPAIDGLRSVFDALRARGWHGHTVVGGNHASMAPERIFAAAPTLSALVHGDGEEALCNILDAIRDERSLFEVSGLTMYKAGGLVRTSHRQHAPRLDALPFPARDTLPHVLTRGGTPYVSASRGCYARCKFCTITEFYGSSGPKWRGRSPENIIKEMRTLVDNYAIKQVFFVDDNFIGPGNAGKRRVLDLAKELSKANLRVAFSIQTRSDDIDVEIIEALQDVGLRVVFLGLESGSQEVLDLYQKDNSVLNNIGAVKLLNRCNVAGIYGLIMFNPNTTWAQFYDTVSFMRSVGDYNLQWTSSILRDLPGALFEAEFAEAKRVPSEDGFTFFEVRDPGVRHLARVLNWLTAPISDLCISWEELKWSINMQFDRDLMAIEHFRTISASMQERILLVLLDAARIVERAWKQEGRLAGELDLVSQRLSLLALSEEYSAAFSSTHGSKYAFATAPQGQVLHQ